ncbi:MAG: EpsG family protein [Treponema sp.]|nr:EpsG family protein [Treponema sp.]
MYNSALGVKVPFNTPIEFFFALLPLLLLTGFRYGIGADYFNYKIIYERLHSTPFKVYLVNHFGGTSEYYTEIGWYIINRFSYNYNAVLFIAEMIIFTFLYKGISFFKYSINVPFAIIIYCFTQLLYSWNGIRFAIAVVIIFSGFKYIICKKLFKYIFTVIIAMLFHKTAVICVPLYLLTEFKSKKLNSLRNIILYLFVILFPLFIKGIITMSGKIFLFQRYLSAAIYAIGDFHFTPMFIFHVIPVIIPLLIYGRQLFKNDVIAKILLRIYLLEIPFREAGMISKYLTRLSRFPQVVGIILVPYVLESLPRKWTRIYLYIYFFVWYLFTFFYYAIINDEGCSYPYYSILTF